MKFKQIFLVLMLLLFSAFTLLSGVACTEPDAPPAAPQGEPPAAPYVYHTVKNTTPLPVDALWDKPDEVVCLSKDTPITLTEQQSAAVYDLLHSLMPQALTVLANDRYFNTARFEQWRQESFCVELRYDQRRSYSGELETVHHFELGDSISVEYDAILLMIRDDIFYVYLYVDGNYYGLLDRDMQFLFNGIEDVFLEDICELLELSDDDFDVPTKNVKSSWTYGAPSDTEQIENTFLPMPDDMVYCNTSVGDEIPLTKEEQQRIYEAFLSVLVNKQEEGQEDPNQPPLICRHETNEDVNDLIEEYGAVEFRYMQPQKVAGRLITPSGEELLDPEENIEDQIAYSTVVIVPHINHYNVFFERNGEYSFFEQINSVRYNYEMMQEYIWLVEGIIRDKNQ